MVAKKSRKISVDDAPSFGLNLGDLLKIKKKEENTETATIPKAKAPPQKLDFSHSEKVVLRHQRKGRGGRLVTLVSGLNFPQEGLQQLVKEIRRSFGCGANVEGEDLVLQGDQLEKTRMFLERKGIKRIILGSRPR